MIIGTMIKDYFFCKRLIYFKNVLNLGEVITEKMKEGAIAHKRIEERLKRYDFLNLPENKKLFRPTLVYDDLKGVPDCVLFFKNEASPLEFKRGVDKLYYYYKYQLLFYGFLIEVNFKIKVNKGFVWYEDYDKIKVVYFSDNEKDFLNVAIKDIKDILNKGIMPKGSHNCRRCNFKNVCERF